MPARVRRLLNEKFVFVNKEIAMPDSPEQKPAHEIAIANAMAIAQQPAMLANLAYANTVTNANLAQQNAVAAQQAMNELNITVVGKLVNMLTTLSPLEAKSSEEILTGNTVAEELADLKAALQAFQANRPSASQ